MTTETEVGIEARVAECVKEYAEVGFWRTCSGCHETEDGHDVGHYPFNKAFDCKLGSGCSECGGIGAVWDTTDYADMGASISSEPPSPATETEVLEVVARLGGINGVKLQHHIDMMRPEAQVEYAKQPALVHQSEALAIIERLTKERDEAQDSAHNWHAQCQSIAAILDLHEPECLGFAGEVRAKFEAAEHQVQRLTEALGRVKKALVHEHTDAVLMSGVKIGAMRCEIDAALKEDGR